MNDVISKLGAIGIVVGPTLILFHTVDTGVALGFLSGVVGMMMYHNQ